MHALTLFSAFRSAFFLVSECFYFVHLGHHLVLSAQYAADILPLAMFLA